MKMKLKKKNNDTERVQGQQSQNSIREAFK